MMAWSFQHRVSHFVSYCFGQAAAKDVLERSHRFLEEALELVQASGATAADAHALVDYVYGRPAGEKAQEVGGVMLTLAALCEVHGLSMDDAGEIELARVWTKVNRIRQKQAAKKADSALPGMIDHEKAHASLVPKLREMLKRIDGMSNDEYGAWVDALPADEFAAFIAMAQEGRR